MFMTIFQLTLKHNIYNNLNIDMRNLKLSFFKCYNVFQKTTAYRRYKDDVPHEIKVERVKKMFNVFRRDAEILNKQFVNTEQLMLVEGVS